MRSVYFYRYKQLVSEFGNGCEFVCTDREAPLPNTPISTTIKYITEYKTDNEAIAVKLLNYSLLAA